MATRAETSMNDTDRGVRLTGVTPVRWTSGDEPAPLSVHEKVRAVVASAGKAGVLPLARCHGGRHSFLDRFPSTERTGAATFAVHACIRQAENGGSHEFDSPWTARFERVGRRRSSNVDRSRTRQCWHGG